MSTFKVKIGVAAFVVVAAVTFALYFIIAGPLATQAEREVVATVEQASLAVPRLRKHDGFELAAAVQSMSRRPEFVKAIQEGDEKKRRAAVFDAITQLDQELRSQEKKADFLGVVDKDGAVIARDLDMNDMYGDKLDYPVVQRALKGHTSGDIWVMKNRMMRAAMAPIIVGGQVRGAVALAYDFTAAYARDARRHVGAQVAYFLDNAVRASSFTVAGSDTTEDAARVAGLNKAILGESGLANKAVAEGKVSELQELQIQGERYKVLVGPLPEAVFLDGDAAKGVAPAATRRAAGFAVVASMDQALQPVVKVRYLIVGSGLGMMLLVLLVVTLMARHYVGAEDRLELGVNEVMNGNLEYTFDAMEEFEGLANALNVMLARLLGRPEPGEEATEGEEVWRADVISIEELDGSPVPPELAQQLASEPEDVYYGRLYAEYVDARRRLNLPVEGLDLPALAQKLRANEAMLKAKHKCQMIRFMVRSSAGKATFKPVRLG
ncbi:MAG: hypothetical protein IT371_02780 [Deltaproteobacteria bacterium]|nr:hypothetical protein [Deltaproteobacteria bacterium]